MCCKSYLRPYAAGAVLPASLPVRGAFSTSGSCCTIHYYSTQRMNLTMNSWIAIKHTRTFAYHFLTHRRARLAKQYVPVHRQKIDRLALLS
jgi:hypothetical protein